MDEQQRKYAENEVVFRKANEAATKELEALQQTSTSEGEHDLAPNDELPMYFYCECADEKCHERIRLTKREYEDLHQSSDQFVILPGHNVPEVERIVQNNQSWMVVEKIVTPPSDAEELNKTKLQNG